MILPLLQKKTILRSVRKRKYLRHPKLMRVYLAEKKRLKKPLSEGRR